MSFLSVLIIKIRYLSDSPRKGFLSGLFDNIKDEFNSLKIVFNKNKKVKEIINKMLEIEKLKKEELLQNGRDTRVWSIETYFYS